MTSLEYCAGGKAMMCRGAGRVTWEDDVGTVFSQQQKDNHEITASDLLEHQDIHLGDTLLHCMFGCYRSGMAVG